jgi:hypothetical protein
MPKPTPAPDVLSLVLTLRGKRVLLDSDLARLYGVPTRVFNQTIRRNAGRFPADFLFQITDEEFEFLRSQIVTSKAGRGGRRYQPYVFTEHGAIMAATLLRSERANQAVKRNPDRFPSVFCFQLMREELRKMLSQSVMTSTQSAVNKSIKYRRSDRMPLVFSEYGALMAATVLNSTRAVQMSIFIIRAFVSMRQELMTSAVILEKLAEIDTTLIEHDDALRAIWHQLQPLLQPPPEPPKRRIGFLS